MERAHEDEEERPADLGACATPQALRESAALELPSSAEPAREQQHQQRSSATTSACSTPHVHGAQRHHEQQDQTPLLLPTPPQQHESKSAESKEEAHTQPDPEAHAQHLGHSAPPAAAPVSALDAWGWALVAFSPQIASGGAADVPQPRSAVQQARALAAQVVLASCCVAHAHEPGPGEPHTPLRDNAAWAVPTAPTIAGDQLAACLQRVTPRAWQALPGTSAHDKLAALCGGEGGSDESGGAAGLLALRRAGGSGSGSGGAAPEQQRHGDMASWEVQLDVARLWAAARRDAVGVPRGVAPGWGHTVWQAQTHNLSAAARAQAQALSQLQSHLRDTTLIASLDAPSPLHPEQPLPLQQQRQWEHQPPWEQHKRPAPASDQQAPPGGPLPEHPAASSAARGTEAAGADEAPVVHEADAALLIPADLLVDAGGGAAAPLGRSAALELHAGVVARSHSRQHAAVAAAAAAAAATALTHRQDSASTSLFAVSPQPAGGVSLFGDDVPAARFLYAAAQHVATVTQHVAVGGSVQLHVPTFESPLPPPIATPQQAARAAAAQAAAHTPAPLEALPQQRAAPGPAYGHSHLVSPAPAAAAAAAPTPPTMTVLEAVHGDTWRLALVMACLAAWWPGQPFMTALSLAIVGLQRPHAPAAASASSSAAQHEHQSAPPPAYRPARVSLRALLNEAHRLQQQHLAALAGTTVAPDASSSFSSCAAPTEELLRDLILLLSAQHQLVSLEGEGPEAVVTLRQQVLAHHTLLAVLPSSWQQPSPSGAAVASSGPGNVGGAPALPAWSPAVVQALQVHSLCPLVQPLVRSVQAGLGLAHGELVRHAMLSRAVKELASIAGLPSDLAALAHLAAFPASPAPLGTPPSAGTPSSRPPAQLLQARHPQPQASPSGGKQQPALFSPAAHPRHHHPQRGLAGSPRGPPTHHPHHTAAAPIHHPAAALTTPLPPPASPSQHLLQAPLLAGQDFGAMFEPQPFAPQHHAAAASPTGQQQHRHAAGLYYAPGAPGHPPVLMTNVPPPPPPPPLPLSSSLAPPPHHHHHLQQWASADVAQSPGRLLVRHPAGHAAAVVRTTAHLAPDDQHYQQHAATPSFSDGTGSPTSGLQALKRAGTASPEGAPAAGAGKGAAWASAAQTRAVLATSPLPPPAPPPNAAAVQAGRRLAARREQVGVQRGSAR